jgi:tetratricopeptide (TPR) repeat protein
LKIAIYSKNGQREQLIKSVELLSFIKEYFNIKESTYLGRRFHKAGEFLSPHNPDRAIELIDEALNIFNKKNVASEIPKCYHDMALAYYYKSAFGQAVSLLNKAIVLYQDQEFDNKWLIVRAYQLQGECEIRRKNFGIGEKLIRKSIAQIEKMEYPQEVGVVQVGTAREYSLRVCLKFHQSAASGKFYPALR